MTPKIRLKYIVISNLGVVAMDYQGENLICGGEPFEFDSEKMADDVCQELNGHKNSDRLTGRFEARAVGTIRLSQYVVAVYCPCGRMTVAQNGTNQWGRAECVKCNKMFTIAPQEDET